MANTVPVLQIPIDDSQWKAFQETFAKFQIDAADVPAAMGAIERAIERMPEHLRPINDALMEAADAAEEAADMWLGGGGGSSSGGGLPPSENDNTPGVPNAGGGKRPRKRGARKVTKKAAPPNWNWANIGARRFGLTISGTTRELAKWERLTAVFAGLLGVGGLYGINALAARGAERRREASGLGVSTGELASFETNYARLGDTSGILAGLSQAETDIGKRQPLQSLGVDPKGKSSLQIFGEMLPKLKDIAEHADPNTFSASIRPYNLDALGIDEHTMRLIRAMPREEIESMRRNARRDVGQLGVPDDVGRKWQDLITTFHKAETRIQTALADDLVQLTPSLTHLSDTTVHLLDQLLSRKELKDWLERTNKGLLWFADEIGSEDAQTKFKTFLHHFDMAKSDFDALNNWLTNHSGLLVTTLAIGAGWRAAGPAGAAAAAVIVGGHYAGQAIDPLIPRLPAPQSGGRTLGDDLGLPGVDTPVPDKSSQGPAPAGTGSVDKDLSGDLSKTATYGRQGEEVADPQAFIVHHTGGRGSAEGVVNTLNGRGLGVQYVLDRDGRIFRTLPEGHRGAHILNGNVDGKQLSNANTLGMEVIAKDDSDVNPAQIEAARKFYADLHKKYPHIEAYGHGYVNPGHKQASEGQTITNAIRADEKAAAQGPARDATKAAQEAAAGVPLGQRGFMRGYAGRDSVPKEMQSRRDHRRMVSALLAPHPYTRPKPPQTVVVTDNSGGSSTVTVAH